VFLSPPSVLTCCSVPWEKWQVTRGISSAEWSWVPGGVLASGDPTGSTRIALLATSLATFSSLVVQQEALLQSPNVART
jgi:hypothetical protein